MADAGGGRRPADDRGGVPDALPPDSGLPRTPVHDSVPGTVPGCMMAFQYAGYAGA